MYPTTDSVERYLDRLEEQLPAVPAAALRVQRQVGKRMAALLEDLASSWHSSARTATDAAGEAAATVVGTARDAGGDVIDSSVTATRRVVGQARAEAGQTVDAVSDQAGRVAEATKEAVEEAGSQAVEALDAVDQVMDPDTTPTGEVYENLTKAELYANASKLEIVGRSKMSKDELIDALRAAR